MASTTIKVKLNNVPGAPNSGGGKKKLLLLLAVIGGGYYCYKKGIIKINQDGTIKIDKNAAKTTTTK